MKLHVLFEGREIAPIDIGEVDGNYAYPVKGAAVYRTSDLGDIGTGEEGVYDPRANLIYVWDTAYGFSPESVMAHAMALYDESEGEGEDDADEDIFNVDRFGKVGVGGLSETEIRNAIDGGWLLFGRGTNHGWTWGTLEDTQKFAAHWPSDAPIDMSFLVRGNTNFRRSLQPSQLADQSVIAGLLKAMSE